MDYQPQVDSTPTMYKPVTTNVTLNSNVWLSFLTYIMTTFSLYFIVTYMAVYLVITLGFTSA